MLSSGADAGPRARAACGLSVALALGLGLCGIDWGLPGPDRFGAMPQRVRGDALFAKRLSEAWSSLYEGIERSHEALEPEEPVTYVKGVEVVDGGWSWPPDVLLNSLRSFLLRTQHPDEQKSFVVLSRMRPWDRDFKPLYLEYGGGFVYPLGAWLWTLSKLGAVSLVADVKHYLMRPGDMGGLFLWARLYVVLFHALTVALVFRLARRMGGVEAGFFASALYAILPVVVVQTHVVKPHPVAAFWLLAAVDAAVSAREGGGRGWPLASGALAGVAAAANFSLAGAALLPVLAWLLRGAKKAEALSAVLGVLAGAAVFAALNPYVVYSPRDYLWETTVYPAGHAGPSVRGLLSLLGPHFAAALGLGLQLLLALALARAALRRADLEPAEQVVAASFALGLAYLWLGLALLWGFSTGPGAARFFYALFPLAAALGAAWAARAGAPAWLRALLVLAAFADAGRRSAVYLENFRLEAAGQSTRAAAAAWVEKNVAPGSTLGLTRFPQPATTPALRFDRYRLVIFSDPALLDAKTRPPLVVTDESGRSLLARASSPRWTVAAEFRPALENLALPNDDSFFANAPMYVMRPEK